MAILTAFLVACVLALSTAKGSLIYIFLIYILLLCCKIIFQFNSIQCITEIIKKQKESLAGYESHKVACIVSKSKTEKELQLLVKVADIMSRTEGTSVCRAL